MIITINSEDYIVTESRNIWRLKAQTGKLSIAFEIPKELCATVDELREYVSNNLDSSKR